MTNIRVFAFLLTVSTAAFVSSGCVGNDDSDTVSKVHACAVVTKNGERVTHLNGQVVISWYSINGSTHSGQNSGYYANGVAYDQTGQPIGQSDGQSAGNSVQIGIENNDPCGFGQIGQELKNSDVQVSSVVLNGASFDMLADGTTGAGDGLQGHASLGKGGYSKATKTVDVEVRFNLDHKGVADPGQLFSALQKRLQNLNRKPGFSATAIADRRSNPRPDREASNESARPTSANAAI